MTRRKPPVVESAPSVPELIRKKRDGGQLTEREITALVRGYVDGEVPDYQMSAFAMATFFRGMKPDEVVALTLAMRDSGEVLPTGGFGGPAVDKHSTGGVGDKVSLCLAPLVASLGVRVPMISGRGLGHTGGTVDKLESIAGFSLGLAPDALVSLVRKHGMAFGRQTDDIAPADRRLYALRDVTATVESIPLITASILSKKLAEGLDGLVLDVKVGRGAFMRTRKDATHLARSLVTVARGAGVRVSALITDMDAPLGKTIGNALETREAIDVLHGGGPEDVVALTVALAAEMLKLARLVRSRRDGETLARAALRDGRARRTFERIVEAQGGDPRVVAEPDRLPSAPVRHVIHAAKAGFVVDLEPMALGLAAMHLGAGRRLTTDVIDPAVGLELHAQRGDQVTRGAPLVTVHAKTEADATAVEEAIVTAIRIAPRRTKLRELLIERIGD
jgi:pyrimidine-nucleoside phosphorylase